LKKNNGFPAVEMFNGDFEPGEGPLPPGTEDGFDPTIKLDKSTGRVVRKSEAELNAKKWQPTGEFSGPLVVYTDGSALGNGKVGAVAGVGVYFGSNDARYVSS
jgi:ribonuclease HI